MNVQHTFDSSNKISWCLDSGSTSRKCAQKSNFTELNKVKGENKIRLASEDHTSSISGIGQVTINHEKGVARLSDTLHVPQLSTNFMSVG